MATSKPKTIIITGAGGFLGSALVKYFKKQGWHVIALVRNAKKYKQAGVEYVEYDLTQPLDDSVFAGADYLVHAAYVKYDRKHPDAMNINLEGAKQLLKASRQHKLKSVCLSPACQRIPAPNRSTASKNWLSKNCSRVPVARRFAAA